MPFFCLSVAALVFVVWPAGMILATTIRRRRLRKLRGRGFTLIMPTMTHRVLCYRNGDYEPAASSEPMTKDEADTLARERMAQGFEVFVVEAGERQRVKGEPWRIVPPFTPE